MIWIVPLFPHVKGLGSNAEIRDKIKTFTNLDELKTFWASLPVEWKQEFETLKEEQKQKYAK